MFRWASAQPLPQRLAELMDRCGALRSDWFERNPSDVLVFLPPHLLLSGGKLPFPGIQTSFRLLQEAGGTGVLLNGERLLNLSAAELAAWQPGNPLPRPCSLHPVPPVEAALTSALLAVDPNLTAAYHDLDARAERGGAPADGDYAARLECRDASELVHHWNQQLERRQAEVDLELMRLQLLEVEQECERQFLACQEADRSLRKQRRLIQEARKLLKGYRDLILQLLGMQSQRL